MPFNIKNRHVYLKISSISFTRACTITFPSIVGTISLPSIPTHLKNDWHQSLLTFRPFARLESPKQFETESPNLPSVAGCTTRLESMQIPGVRTEPSASWVRWAPVLGSMTCGQLSMSQDSAAELFCDSFFYCRVFALLSMNSSQNITDF